MGQGISAAVDVIGGRSFPRTESVGCPLCGRSGPPRRLPVVFGQYAMIVRCRGCRLAYQSPRPSPEATLAYMNVRWDSADAYVADPSDQRRRALVQLGLVNGLMGGRGRLLDFGAGVGAFTRVALDDGWRADGVERSGAAVRRAQDELGVELTSMPTCESYDAITLWDVVEHLRDPEATLKDLAARLKPGGRIFIETGNWESWRRVLEGDRWGLYLFDHQYYFSPPSLRRMLERCGLQEFELLGGSEEPFSFRAAAQTAGWMGAVRVWLTLQTVWRSHGRRYLLVAAATRPF